MRMIIGRICGGGAKSLKYLLAGLFVFAMAQSAQATYYYWTGAKDDYWDTSGNWTKVNSSNGRLFNQKSYTRTTVKFQNATDQGSERISVERGFTTSSPLVFLATSDSNGVKTTGNLEVGYNNGQSGGKLDIQRGTYQCGKVVLGQNKDSQDPHIWMGGSGNNVVLTSTGKVEMNKGTLHVKSNGKLICQGWAAAGNKDSTSGTLEIDGGEVQHNTANYLTIGDTASSTGYVYVKNGGKYSNTGSNANGLCVGQKGTGTLEVDNGTVDLGTKAMMLCDNTNGKATVNVKNGGVVTMGGVTYGTGTGGATMTIDGGTIKAAQDNADFIPALDNLNVYVGASGATFDTDGHVVTIGENLQNKSGEAGAVTFKGGGAATLSAEGSYTGTTTVEVGTTLIVPTPGSIGAGLVVVAPVETPADGIYTILSCSGEGVFTDAVLDGVAAPTGATLSVSPDGKTVRCTYGDGGPVWIGGTSGSLSDPTKWANGAVPGVGTNCVIGVSSAATLTVGDTFAASSITFPADSAAVTINASGNESMTGIAAITNLSLTASHTINVPVYFTGDIQVKQDAMADEGDLTKAHVVFAGGAYAAPDCAIESGSTSAVYSRCMFGEYHLASTAGNPWDAQYYGSDKRVCLADNSTLYVPYAGIWTELHVCSGARVFVGDMTMAHSGNTNHRVSHQNYGEVVVTNLTLTGTADRFCTYNQPVSSPSVFKFNSITNKMTTNWFYFGDKNCATAGTYYIGEGGLNFENSTSCYCLGGSNMADNKATLRPWYSDFTVQDIGDGNRGLAFDHDVEICTDDEGDTGRTITINAKTYARNNPTITVSGSGTLKVNNTNNNAAQPTVTVKDTATLAFAAGASLGTGPLVLGAGTTLALASGAEPIVVSSLTLPESGTATIQITGDAALADGEYALLLSTEGLPAGFETKINVVAPEGTSAARRLYTSDSGTLCLLVGDGPLPDPYTWTGAASDGKMNTPGNWRGNAVPPTGAKVIIPPTAGTLDNNIEGFAPASITFGYGDGAVTIGGNAITGVAAITNNSAATHTINVPVAFADKILVAQGAMAWDLRSNPSIRFAGGVTGTTFADGTARYLDGAFDLSTGADWVANTTGSDKYWGLSAGSWLTLPEASDTSELVLGDSNTAGGAFTTGVQRTSARLCCYNYGEYVVTNEFIADFPANAGHFCGYDKISNGKFKFEKMTLSGAYNQPFKFGNSNSNTGDTGTQRFYIGRGGLCFADGASQNLRYESGGAKNNATVRIEPWYGDYTIHTKGAANPTDFTISTVTYFGTTDENGNACTVTDEGVINSYGSAAQIHFDGKGTFVANAVGTATCPVTVHGGSGTTLAINPGKKLTTGSMTVNSGATLKVAESGTVTLGGDLTLNDGACLGFNFTGRRDAMPQLALASGKTLSFAEGATTNITVKITSDVGWPIGGEKVLTDCGGFTKEIVSLSSDAPQWVDGLSVNDDGNIVLTVKKFSTMILIR